MIAARENFPQLTPQEYFAWEEKQIYKHEYIEGQVYAMSGGSVNHARIAIRFITMFDAHLGAGNCIIGNSDLRIKMIKSENYTYPDVSITCDDRDKATTQYITYPSLIVEVLSPSTEAYDRGGKFRLYANNPVLQDYLLVSSTSIEIDLYHKKDNGEWIIINYQEGDMIELKSINLTFAIAQIYRGLVLTSDTEISQED
ncbi:Uma2 family endonuclease [Pseudanabaena biceps]|nr:Uma2 family endonuclease [Pseudanabaena biceps]